MTSCLTVFKTTSADFSASDRDLRCFYLGKRPNRALIQYRQIKCNRLVRRDQQSSTALLIIHRGVLSCWECQIDQGRCLKTGYINWHFQQPKIGFLSLLPGLVYCQRNFENPHQMMIQSFIENHPQAFSVLLTFERGAVCYQSINPYWQDAYIRYLQLSSNQG
ncbi:hypothetical protein FGO68_gene5826 [Halteria grandinella]|uniref:Uncharacterized protein n=1 Tax=Halteria grandinella TaxID=5974 RepID=A0A8J8T5H0_HALGN|nr:hypothetical protein FGO68_gene5826 [Halteria grandinella]